MVKVKNKDLTLSELKELKDKAYTVLSLNEDNIKTDIAHFLRHKMLYSVTNLESHRADVGTDIKDVSLVEQIALPLSGEFSNEFDCKLFVKKIRKLGGVVFHGGDISNEGYTSSTYFVSVEYGLKLSNNIVSFSAANHQSLFEIAHRSFYHCRFDVDTFIDQLVMNLACVIVNDDNTLID